MSRRLAIYLVAVAATWVGLANAQSISSCPASDLPCIENSFALACRMEESTHETCSAWLRELEASPIAESPNARLTAASAYTTLSETSEAPEDSVRFQAEASRILRDLVAENPADVQALLGLARRAPTPEERIAILERIVEVDPSYAFGWEALADAVDDSEKPNDLIQSAQYLENAYNILTDEKKWYIASDAISRYRRAGSADRAGDFMERVRVDFDLDRKLDQFRDVSHLPPSLRAEMLRSICSAPAINIFGGTSCLDAVGAVVEFVKEAPNTQFALTAAEDSADAMVRAAESGWRMDGEIPDWHQTLLTWMDEIVDSGKVSAPLYVAQARLARDKLQRLLAMQEAARLAPLDGEIAFGLGLAYLDLERWDTATAELTRARNLLPEERRKAIDEALDRISDSARK